MTSMEPDFRKPDPARLISGATGDWEMVLGLEVHAQVASRAKLFSGAATAFGEQGTAGRRVGHEIRDSGLEIRKSRRRRTSPGCLGRRHRDESRAFESRTPNP